MNEAKYTYDINPLWGDLDNAMEEIDNSAINNSKTMTNKENNKNHSKEYDLQTNYNCYHTLLPENQLTIVSK